jgi:hypothetical protein
MKKLSLIVALGIALVVTACSTKLYEPSEANVNKRVTASLVDLQKGREIYAEKCGQCHRVYKPEKFSLKKWGDILAVMAPKAKLTEIEQEYIFRYIVNHNGKDK